MSHTVVFYHLWTTQPDSIDFDAARAAATDAEAVADIGIVEQAWNNERDDTLRCQEGPEDNKLTLLSAAEVTDGDEPIEAFESFRRFIDSELAQVAGFFA